MFDFLKKSRTDVLDRIEDAVYAELKPHGFRRYGRTLHRFVSGDFSQVIHFQLGESRRGENHLLYVNVGIRVPECVERSFAAELEQKKYYHEYECNMRSRLGTVEGREEACYDLRKSADDIQADILRQITEIVIPAFDVLGSREGILCHRREYPQFDTFNDHLIRLEEAMIYGRRGDRKKAAELFRQHYEQSGDNRNHQDYLRRLAMELELDI